MDSPITKQENKRLLSLDILRGITIAGMILVNSPGSWSHIYAPLQHTSWHGLTPTDLVFPFFVFMMGVSAYFSMRKFNFAPSRQTFQRIAKRTIIMFMLGIALAWLALFMDGLFVGENILQAATRFDQLRIPGVLQRLALAYGFSSLLILYTKDKKVIWAITTLLLGYYIILLLGNGFERSINNIVGKVDRAVFGAQHLFREYDIINEQVMPFDPEGLLGTIPTIAQVLIGFLFGQLIIQNKNNHTRVEKMLIWGTILLFSGLLLHYGCPMNKKLWTPTYVLATSGFAALLFGLLIWIIDIKGYDRWTKFFHSFGVNPLIIYIFSGLIEITAYSVRFTYKGDELLLKAFIFEHMLQPWAGNNFGSLLYALLVVLLSWLFGYTLYKRNIYIKI